MDSWRGLSSRRFVRGIGASASGSLILFPFNVNIGSFLTKSTSRVQRLWSVFPAFSKVILPQSRSRSRGHWSPFPVTPIFVSSLA